MAAGKSSNGNVGLVVFLISKFGVKCVQILHNSTFRYNGHNCSVTWLDQLRGGFPDEKLTWLISSRPTKSVLVTLSGGTHPSGFPGFPLISLYTPTLIAPTGPDPLPGSWYGSKTRIVLGILEIVFI